MVFHPSADQRSPCWPSEKAYRSALSCRSNFCEWCKIEDEEQRYRGMEESYTLALTNHWTAAFRYLGRPLSEGIIEGAFRKIKSGDATFQKSDRISLIINL